MGMNFSDYCNSMHDPLFTEDKKPTCKPGFVYDKGLKKCIPAANAKTTNKEKAKNKKKEKKKQKKMKAKEKNE